MEDPVGDAVTKRLADDSPAKEFPIEELGLRARTVHLLQSAGITTVGAALAALEDGDGELAAVKGVGPKSVDEVREALAERGFLDSAATVRLSGSGGPGLVGAAVPDGAGDDALDEASTQVLFARAEEAAPEEKAPLERVPSLSAAAAAAAPVGQPVAGPSFLERLQAFFAGNGLRVAAIALGVLGLALLLVALFLPPLSLLDRISGYTRLDAEHAVVTHPDGITLRVDEDQFTDKLKVKLGSVPRLEFLEGSAGKSLRAAAEALPANLVARSPLYELKARGQAAQPVVIDVAVPNDSEPWQNLDLYTWNGKAWEWVGSELHTEVAEQEFMRATVAELPGNLLVVQHEATTPAVSAYLHAGDVPVSTAAGMVDEVNPVGLLLGTMGGFAGDIDNLPQSDVATVAVVPTLRNWAPGGSVNRGLVSDMLATPESQATHIAKMLQLCSERGFAGVELDYRGVGPEEAAAYTGFVQALSQAMHEQGLRLTVVLEPPVDTGSGWDTGGYDWGAIGAAADAVKVRFPDDPTAYSAGGAAERLLDWAKSQVPRPKLRMLVSALSTDRAGDSATPVSLEQALALFGQATALQDVSQVAPGTQLEFGLSSTLLSVTPMQGSGTYRLEYQGDDGQAHTVWLGTAGSLASKLQWASAYNLGGVAVEDLLDPGNAEGILGALAWYRSAGAAPTGEMAVQWTVDDGSQVVDQQSKPLTEPSYTWMVLADSGRYNVGASIGGFDHGSVVVTVGTLGEVATPAVVTSTVVPTDTATVTKTVEVTETETVSVCLNATYVSDVTIPDNTVLQNGEEFTKTWRVRNSGECPWPEDTVIAFVSGSQMEAPATVAVGALEPGQEKDISVKMKAPAEVGRYTGNWRIRGKDGLFGGNLTVVIQAGEQPEAANVPSVVAPVLGGSFELGGHILNGGYPYASQMHYAGMNWSKVQVRWDPGNNNAGVIQAAHANGFKIQLSALGSPNLVTSANFESNFAAWVASMAAAGADAIEIWNEPNIDREWQVGSISPAAYTRLLCACYSAIKAANPNCAVISAAPAPTGWFGGCSANGCDDLPWISGLRDAGAANCMDYIGAHHNSGATSPSASTGHPADDGNHHHSWYFLPQTQLYYNTFGGARKLFYTEMGYASQEGLATFSDSFSWARGTNNAQQAQWLAEAASLGANTGMVRCIIVWNIDFVRAGYDPQDGYAIIRPGGGCPACDSLHAVLGSR